MGSTGSSGIVSSGIQQGAIGYVTGSIGGSIDAALKGGNKNNYSYKGKKYSENNKRIKIDEKIKENQNW